MKMKILAAFLAFTVFITFTIGNAVAVTSVVLISKFKSTIIEPVAQKLEQTIPVTDTQTETSQQTPEISEDVNTQPGENVQTAGDNDTVDEVVTSPEENATVQNTEPIDKNALEMFKNAVNEVKNGGAGYTKKHWQTITSPLNLDQLQNLSGMLTSMMTEIMITEDELEDGDFALEKGSAEAIDAIASYSASENTMQSVTQQKDGENTVITIVMKDSLNPTREDTDGISLMSVDLLYIEDVRDKIERDGVVNALVKELTKGDITYKSFTVTATLDSQGKLLEITHYCDSYVEASAETIFGTISGNCGIGFYAKYYDFKY